MCKTVAIILAGGSGKRMGSAVKKQYLELEGREILAHTLMRFEEMDKVDEIVVVTSEEDIEYVRMSICNKNSISKVKKIVSGGEERQDSVYNGLVQVKDAELIIIHDGARPFVSLQEIEKCLKKAKQTGAAILGVPVKDTIKQVDEQGKVVNTPDRKTLWAVQTPQIFDAVIVKEAYEYAKEHKIQGTDDSSLVEAMGKNVHIVEGRYTNIKITTPEDLLLGAQILKGQPKDKVEV